MALLNTDTTAETRLYASVITNEMLSMIAHYTAGSKLHSIFITNVIFPLNTTLLLEGFLYYCSYK